MSLVVDASAALGWLVKSQATIGTRRLAASRERFEAPEIFAFEVRSALIKLERRGKCDPQDTDRRLPAVARRVRLIPLEDASARHVEILALARALSLGYFDAVYLDLAIRRDAPLATRDAALLRAATAHGAKVVDLR